MSDNNYADLVAAQAAEIERLTRERDEAQKMLRVHDHALRDQMANRDAANARAAALEAERDALRERINVACEMAERAIHNPEGTLWNLGTTSTARDRAKWEGVRETAQDILGVLDRTRALAAFDGQS